MLGNKCLRCRKTLIDHSFQLFATAIATQENDGTLRGLIQLAKGFDWEKLAQFQEFDGTKNALEIFALASPNRDLTLLFVQDPFELFDGDSLEDCVSVPNDSAAKCHAALLRTKWNSFAEVGDSWLGDTSGTDSRLADD